MPVPWKLAIVVGASSGMGEAISRRLAENGCKVALVARRKEELNAISSSINESAGREMALPFPFDVVDAHSTTAKFHEIVAALGGLDAIFYTAGVMPAIAPDEYNIGKDDPIIQVNCLGAVAWINAAAHRFTQMNGGTIVGISSVAGDRGRRGNPVYGASKAFLNTYLESVRNRAARRGVNVITIKPGPVETPMTESLGHMPGMISAQEAADAIIIAARDRVEVAYVPAKWKLIMAIVKAIPSSIFRYLNI